MGSKNLLQLIDIPDSLGHYGLDDTFVVNSANMLIQKGYDIKQYVLQDIVVMEDRIYRSKSMDPFITLGDHKDDMRDKWNDILVNMKWTHKDNGFFKIWINNTGFF